MLTGHPTRFPEDLGILLANDPSTDCQPAPVSRVPEELPFRLEADGLPATRSGEASDEAPLIGAIVRRVVSSVDRLSPHARDGARGPLAGDAVKAGPPRGDEGGDRLRHAGASGAGLGRGVEPRTDPHVAADPAGRPGRDRDGRLGARQVPGPLESMAGHADDETRPGRGPAQSLRARHAPAAPPRVSAQVWRGLERVARRCRWGGRADLQHAVQSLGGGRPVRGWTDRHGVGGLAAPARRSCSCRACIIPI